ncbi:hypothetical protein [Myroides odoratus]|uniref:hypothetical protein n=1 Tax=Myroides odoratus TaxID=256 RepID=UPI00333E6FAA
MKINKKIKIVLYCLLTAVIYYWGSIFIDPNSFFIQNHKINSVPKEEAIANKTFIEIVEPNIVYTNKMSYNFYVYKYDFSYLKSYGLLQLFKHRVTVDKQCYYKLIITDPLVELSEIGIQYNDLDTNLFNDVEGFNTMKKNDVMITVTQNDEVLYKALYKNNNK